LSNSTSNDKAIRITIDQSLKINPVPKPLLDTLVDRFQMLNPKWLENERMGRWNRGTKKVLRFYKRYGKNGISLPRGYSRQLILCLKKEGLTYEIDDRRRLMPEVDFSFDGQLKPFQSKAVADMKKKAFGTLNAPTGSGKTVMGLYLISQRKQPTVIVVHTKDLAFQWKERIEQFLHIPIEEIGMIGAGKKKIGDRITVALVQSLYRFSDKVAPETGHLVVDECHRTPSRTFTEAVKAFDCQYMLGLSATPWRRDKLSRLIFWYLGDVHHEVDKSGLEKDGHILKADVVFRPTAFEPYFDPVNDYSRMLSELTADDERNQNDRRRCLQGGQLRPRRLSGAFRQKKTLRNPARDPEIQTWGSSQTSHRGPDHRGTKKRPGTSEGRTCRGINRHGTACR
jgi:hypothetical protein